MLKIRLQRTGRRNQPAFRLIVTEGARGPKTGRVVERVGFYDPVTKEKRVETERVAHWLSVGAQPSDTVHNMLVDAGVVSDKKRNVLPKKSPIVKETDASAEGGEATPTAAPAEAQPTTEDTTEAPTEEAVSEPEAPTTDSSDQEDESSSKASASEQTPEVAEKEPVPEEEGKTQ